jgi:phage terminase large subunit GpA-like protein
MNQTKIERIVAGLMEHWAPPPLKLDQWADENIVLPETQNARPGHYRTWPYLREPLDSIGAKTPEYVSIIKPSRVGFTKGLMIAVAAMAAADPCSIGLLVPVDEDARDYVVDELEPLFVSTPILRGLIIPGRLTGRNTLTRKSFRTGALLKILSARAPRRLRRHDFRVLYCDEIDAMEITVEGDPIVIAEKRTFAHADRKIVRGSTPTEEDISLIRRAYAESAAGALCAQPGGNRVHPEAARPADRGLGRALLRLGGAAEPGGQGDRLARPGGAPAANSRRPTAAAPSFNRIVGKPVQ